MSEDLDFSAWEAPPPPDGLADAVVARMDATAVGLAMPDADAPHRRRWVIAASAAAVLVAVGGLWALVRPREPAPVQNGAVIADRAQHLELGGVSVDVDRGADIHWRRTRDGLAVDQRAGTAVWRVGGDERIVIGAAVASIEAAGASLRVEVPMNMPVSKTDARVIGASALTAAAVAMVTVVVYDGHVKVSSSGQSVVVQPGTTYTVRMPGPEPVVGVAPATVASGKQKLAVLGLEDLGAAGDVASGLSDALRARATSGIGPFVLAPDTAKQLADEKILHDCRSEAPECMAAIGRDLGVDAIVYGSVRSRRDGYEVIAKRLMVGDHRVDRESDNLIPPSDAGALDGWATSIAKTLLDEDALADVPDAAVVDEVLAANADEMRACLANDATSETVRVTIDAAGKATHVSTEGHAGGDRVDSAPCIAQVVQELGFPASKHGGTFTHLLKHATCDVDALIREGNARMEIRGQPGEALAKYEAAVACKAEERTYKLAFMAACNAKNVTKASAFWSKLTAASRNQVLQMCVREGITREQLEPAACDADALVQKGIGLEQVGQHGAALAQFETGIRCRPSMRLYELSFMAACNMKSVSEASRYWEKLPQATRDQMKQVCVRYGITEDMLDRRPPAPAPEVASGQGAVRIDSIPAAKILLDGVEVGATPAVVKATAGKHKVTYVIDGNRYTYPVIVKAGVTETVSKDLQ